MTTVFELNRQEIDLKPLCSFLSSLTLPIVRPADQSLELFLKEKLEAYKNGLSGFLETWNVSPSFMDSVKSQLTEFDLNNKRLVLCVKQFNNNNQSASRILFKAFMDKCHLYHMRLEDIAPLYRIRVDEKGELSNPPKRKELFHIPYLRRGTVKYERYSANGFPCLYLSKNPLVAFLECNQPKKSYVSQFNPTGDIRDWKLVYLQHPHQFEKWIESQKNEFSEEVLARVIAHYIGQIPLLISCSIIEESEKESYFSENYIIPQLLMEWICENRSKTGVYGVAYFSCKRIFSTIHTSNTANVAIPSFNPSEDSQDGYSRLLGNNFNISTPTLIENKESDFQYPVEDPAEFKTIFEDF